MAQRAATKVDRTSIDPKKFGDLIRSRRDDRGLSQTDVAAKLGISQPAVSLIERGTPVGLTEDRIGILMSLLSISEAEVPIAGKPRPATGQKVFVSYSHRDADFLNRLLIHLRPLEKRGLIDPWSDKRIAAGEKWRDEIAKALEQARVAILLISADFLASDFIMENELPPLLKTADKKGTVILPMVLSPCRFTREKSLSTFQSINAPDEPLSGMEEHGRELVYDAVAERIESLFRENPKA